MQLSAKIINWKAVAWTLEDLRPADFSMRHAFELNVPGPLPFWARRLPQRHDDLVGNEIDKMLRARIITPTNSAWFFPLYSKQQKPEFEILCGLRCIECQNEVQSLASIRH